MTLPQRPTVGWWPRRAVRLLAALFLCALPAAVAQQASYTIQVVALSDRDSATDIMGDLLRQGFPAYVVRSTSSAGDVFRVRVGAFANRLAAVLYAEAMPQVAGGQPVPALAEGIPAGLTPLAARLVLAQDLTGLDARLLPVGGSLALRTQQRTPLTQAEYAILGGGAVERVRAWQLSVADDGSRVVVRDMQLWPDTWQDEPGEVLEGYQSSLIALVAERLGRDPGTVRAARYGTTAGAPRLIVVERQVPGASDAELLGLGLPVSGMTPAGPLQYLGVQPEELPGLADGVRVDLVTGSVQGELAPEPAEQEPLAPEPATEPVTEPDSEAPETTTTQVGEPGATAQPTAPAAAGGQLIGGPDWFAQADGPFVRLTVPPPLEGAAATTWRAAFGSPLWSGAGYLLAHQDKTLFLYDFLPRD